MDLPTNVKDLSMREIRELVKKRDLDTVRGFCPERQFRIGMDIGEQAFILRKRAGLTLAEASAEVGISKVTLIKYERNIGLGVFTYVKKLAMYKTPLRKQMVFHNV